MQPQPPTQPAAPVPPPSAPPPPAPYPYPYPAYYPPPPRSEASRILVIVVVVIVAVIVITSALAAVLYVMVSGLITPPGGPGGPGPRTMGVSVTVSPDGFNWTVTVITTPTDLLPASTFLLVRNPQGVIQLARTPLSDLTPSNWATYHAVYDDANPMTVVVAPGDSLVLSRTTYPTGSTIEVSDSAGVLTSRSLSG